MASRRVPLANVPNATNSPIRAVAAAATKRQRSYACDQRELTYGQPPPKKQMVEVDDAESRQGLVRRSGHNPPNAFTRKLEAVREAKAPTRTTEKSQKATSENLETIRQWQKHYRRIFPSFVFYFESFPEDMRIKVSRQAHLLGAREEKFFSKQVTHVVTTRSIPTELDTSSTRSQTPSSNVAVSQASIGQSRTTINPSVLEQSQPSRGKFTFEVPVQKGDILYKARELGIKIWSAEKLQRILQAMFNTEAGEQEPDLNTARRHGASMTQTNAGREADLQQLLQNEKVNGPADRDFTVATQEMAPLRGYYIYIHDMDEQTRPVMVREYAKTTTKEEGKWPQFRVTGPGKCPFVEDPNHSKRAQQEQQPQKMRNDKASTAAPRTRAAAALEAAREGEPTGMAEKMVLVENNNLAKRSTSAAGQGGDLNTSKPLDPPKLIPAKRGNPDSMPPMFGSAQAGIRALPKFAGGEPVASGIQPSNITSAIRSQMISSTAAAPGARAGTTKEIHQLKRKVLEKNSVPSANSMTSSNMNDLRGAINDSGPQSRASKRKAQETLTHIHEDMTLSEEEQQTRKVAAIRQKKAATAEKELKAGYCENCKEKFNDFDEHIVSRKHRKFALTLDNWKELDLLLAQLVRR
ncbi:hypothetical protein K432DRAFT_303934 [Lepidopterella palustris CBS 459.81]|uniref:DBF4-type domain-containing protein n=1 Tax=Lepidopterella palustris CBS 459.81 TaxID=1314670 RepID=A0A8E2E5I7_9PEZI|nr:hypothetical protein K432DRAFT_303934 [Lepidopterella palustris CBS 459.81]